MPVKYLAILLVLFLLTGMQPALGKDLPPYRQPKRTAPQIDPNTLYEDAWRIINGNFYGALRVGDMEWRLRQFRYLGKLRNLDDSYKAIETMLSALKDPHTKFYRREELENVKVSNEPVHAITSGTFGDNIGYVRVRRLLPNTGREFRDALSRLRQSKALVLDLRNVPPSDSELGESATFVLANVLSTKTGITFKLVDSSGYVHSPLLSGEAVYSKPVFVLINFGTAQYAEALAASLKSNIHATLVGERTYGFDLIQSSFRLTDGSAITTTVGKLMTPDDESFRSVGIEPDVTVSVSDDDLKQGRGPWWTDSQLKPFDTAPPAKDLQLNKALELAAKVSSN